MDQLKSATRSLTPEENPVAATCIPANRKLTNFLLWMNEVVAFCEPDKSDWCQLHNDAYHKLKLHLLEKGISLMREKTNLADSPPILTTVKPPALPVATGSNNGETTDRTAVLI